MSKTLQTPWYDKTESVIHCFFIWKNFGHLRSEYNNI